MSIMARRSRFTPTEETPPSLMSLKATLLLKDLTKEIFLTLDDNALQNMFQDILNDLKDDIEYRTNDTLRNNLQQDSFGIILFSSSLDAENEVEIKNTRDVNHLFTREKIWENRNNFTIWEYMVEVLTSKWIKNIKYKWKDPRKWMILNIWDSVEKIYWDTDILALVNEFGSEPWKSTTRYENDSRGFDEDDEMLI